MKHANVAQRATEHVVTPGVAKLLECPIVGAAIVQRGPLLRVIAAVFDGRIHRLPTGPMRCGLIQCGVLLQPCC